MALTITIDQDGIITTVTLAPTEEDSMKNDLDDLPTWIEGAIRGKINNTRKRMVAQGIAALRTDGQTVPATDIDVINAFTAMPGYKDRAAREAEAA